MPIYEVDIARVHAFLKFMEVYIARNLAEVTKAEEMATEALYCLVLTGIEGELIADTPEKSGELKSKLMMAFDIGYFYGKMGAGLK